MAENSHYYTANRVTRYTGAEQRKNEKCGTLIISGYASEESSYRSRTLSYLNKNNTASKNKLPIYHMMNNYSLITSEILKYYVKYDSL